MTRLAVIDEQEITITPLFKMLEVENIPKSETAGHAVMEIREVVEVRFAGTKNYSPIFPTDAMWKREGNQTISYAERWPDQYQAFKKGNPQEANGTPLEMLRPHGVTPEQLSLCRALRIYSVEALHYLEGPAVKTLGMNANTLKDAARAFMADRDKGLHAMDEIAALKAQIAELQSRSTLPPVEDLKPDQIDAVIDAADAAYAAMTDDQIKDEIAKLTGTGRPRGTPSREGLVRSLKELKAAA